MESLIHYLLSVSLLLVVVLLYYRAFLARQRRFQLNRAFLISGSLLAAVLPFLRVNSSSQAWTGAGWVRTLPEVLIGTAKASPADAQVGRGVQDWLGLAYFLVAGLLLLFLLYRLSLLLFKILHSKREKRSGFTLVYAGLENGPSSFFGYLFWDSSLDESAEGHQVIMAHERCHIRQWHSLDLLFMELMKVVFWFNPAVHLLSRDLRRCQEFLADEAAAAHAGKEALFRQVLARQFGSQPFTLTNHFHSQLKTRITMLNKNSGHKALVRYLLILPLAGLMFACTSVEQDNTPNDHAALKGTQATPPRPLDVDSLHTAVADEPQDMEGVEFGEPEEKAQTSPTDPGPNEYVQLQKEPKPLNMNEVAQAIGYPQVAKDAGISGKVIVRVKVGKDGKLMEHVVLKEGHPTLSKAVEAKLYDLEFEPGEKDGKKVNAWVTIPFNFKL